MANRLDRDPPSLNVVEGREAHRANEARIGRFHQGQRAESPAPKAGYKTAICLPVIPKSVLAFREASIQTTMVEYVGLDVSKEETSFCVKDGDGRILARGKAASDPQSLFAALREHCLCPQRIVLETGTMSGWLARELRQLGMAVDVIDVRHAHAVMKLQHNKTDAGDAALLAEIARPGVNGGVKMYRRGGAKVSHGLGDSLSR